VDAIVIRWPSGQVDKLGSEAADQELVVQEGRGVIERNPERNPEGRPPVAAKH
jgi:hypothetical protein